MTSHSDEQLVAACRRGDSEAFGQLVKRYFHSIFALCMGAVVDFHDAEDLTQETFARGFAQIHRLRDARRVRGWLKQIARNLCLDLLRRHRGREVLMPELPDAIVPTGRVNVERIDLNRAVQALPEHFRVPVVFYYFEGRSTQTIAEDLAISPSSVRGRLCRARKELRRLLSDGTRTVAGSYEQ